MDLQPYVDEVRRELSVAAAAGGPNAVELADSLSAPLESAIRLALLEALSEAADLITRELAPGSVDVRLKGRDPEFVVDVRDSSGHGQDVPVEVDDSGGTWRVSLRLADSIRPRVEAAARSDGLSVNAWLVRAVASKLGVKPSAQTDPSKHFSGWVR